MCCLCIGLSEMRVGIVARHQRDSNGGRQARINGGGEAVDSDPGDKRCGARLILSVVVAFVEPQLSRFGLLIGLPDHS